LFESILGRVGQSVLIKKTAETLLLKFSLSISKVRIRKKCPTTKNTLYVSSMYGARYIPYNYKRGTIKCNYG
jgi:hypothetical protein